MIKLALFGQPVSQSLSPRIHARFAAGTGLEIAYDAREVSPGGLADALQQFAAEGGSGCNITLPLKAEAAQLAVSATARVQLARAANTLLRSAGGWHADSTDGPGLLLDLRRQGMDPAGKRLALLGAGGAAASVTASLLEAGPKQLVIFNRSPGKADALVERHRALGSLETGTMGALHKSGPFELVINATSLGHQGKRPPLAPALFAPGGLCYDMNYGSAADALDVWCAAHDIAFASGLGMLVGQAAESFYLWTGIRPAIEPVLEQLDPAGSRQGP